MSEFSVHQGSNLPAFARLHFSSEIYREQYINSQVPIYWVVKHDPVLLKALYNQ